MSTRGYINATLQILGGTAIPLRVSLPDASISIVIDVNGKHFLLPTLVGFLVKQPDFQFPVFIGPFNNIPLIDFTLSFTMQQPAFKVSGTLPDIGITPDRVLSAPTLNADLHPNTCCICISGMVTGGAGDPQPTHFCY